jgi:tripartite-type tricarboxylate transporter receptor subunit TctC
VKGNMKTFGHLKLAVAGTALVLQGLGQPAAAQAYPAKPVHITSSFASGAATDITARMVADKLSKYWSQPVTLEPRPGASGLIALRAVKRAQADGYELLMSGGGTLTIAPALMKNPEFNTLADFEPVSLIFKAPFFVVVPAASPYKSMRELIEAARVAPNKVSYGSVYQGAPTHLSSAMLGHLAGVQMLPVFYKETGQLNQSLVNGDLNFALWNRGTVLPLVKAGKLRFLAIVARARMAEEPGVPTTEESGAPAGYNEFTSWTAFLAPKGTPQPVLQKISADVGRALAEPDVKERFRTLGVEPAPMTPAQMTEHVRNELRLYAEIVKATGIAMQ